MDKAYVVIGANFGDEGKGLMTNYFVKKNPEDSIVVLHNGGAQRGHTVVENGVRHVFHHFGAGTLLGAPTYISEDFIVNPILFRAEWEEIKDFNPVVYVNKNCKITTIYDMMANRDVEASRGINKHGSCGAGVYETIFRNQHGVDFIENPSFKNKTAFTIADIHNTSIPNQFDYFYATYEYYKDYRLEKLGIDPKTHLHSFDANVCFNLFLKDIEFFLSHVTVVDDDSVLNDFKNVIFEGGQGLLLDQHNMDYFPNLTPSNTGLENPMKIIKRLAASFPPSVEVCYVTRSYMTRHGKGKFPTECRREDINPLIYDATNTPNPFQDSLRYGKLDMADLHKRTKKDFNKFYDTPEIFAFMSFALTHAQIAPMLTNSWHFDYISSSDTEVTNKIF